MCGVTSSISHEANVFPTAVQFSHRSLLDDAITMVYSVSIGDVYLIAKLALRLGHAFTKGRKSAPNEFREVENQLYSLSAALSALGGSHMEGRIFISTDLSQPQPRESSEAGQADSTDAVGTMLRSCEETLRHLERIVEKYSCMGKSETSEQSVFKRWSRDLRANWKKVAWTLEGGDLATLRSQLTIHTNSLNLILGVAIK